jgi:phospholipid transport system substrate-binding protein
MLRKIFFTVTVLLFCLQTTASALDPKKAELFMEDIGDKVISILANSHLSIEQRRSQFKEILDTKFNLRAIGKFVLGRHWKEATQEEQELFLSLFKSTTIANYASRFQEYTTEKFEVLSSRLEKDGGVTVLTQIIRSSGQKITIDWKIFEKEKELRIYDVALEGISMGITQRSEFSAVIQNAGGKIRGLLEALKAKVQGLTQTGQIQTEHPEYEQ